MSSSKQSSTNKRRSNITAQKVPQSANLDIFPYPDNKQFKGHGFFMKVIAELKDLSDFPTEDRKIDKEESEIVFEYVSLITRQADLIECREKDVVYEDHFNQSVITMVGWQKFSYDNLVEICSKYECPDHLAEHITRGNETCKLFRDRMDKDEAQAVAFAIAFYTGSQSYGINRSASVVARKSNGEALEVIKHNDLKDASVILYYLVRGLAHLPYYWGVTSRAINLTKEELDLYKPGTLITWLQFSSASKGKIPPKVFTSNRNTRFIVYSLTGRSIKEFSIFPDEEEVLFLPHSTFLVISHDQNEDTHIIYLRQIELGLCQMSVLWVDDNIFDEDWENKTHMQRACTRSVNDNVHFIPKSKTDHALSFLRSPFGQRLKKCPTFRIVTDMRRDNEEEPRFAGIRLIKGIRQLGFQNKCMIFTGYQGKAEEKVKAELTSDEQENLLIAEDSRELYRFIGFEN
jgi:hypothetical protein